MSAYKRFIILLALVAAGLIAVFGLGVSKEDHDLFREAEQRLARGDVAFAYFSFSELREGVPVDSPLRAGVWRGLLRSCPSGESLRAAVQRLLDEESVDVQRKTLSVLTGLHRNDAKLDAILMDALQGRDERVGVPLVELLTSRKAEGLAERLQADFFSYNFPVKRAMVELFPRYSEPGDFQFLALLAFRNDKLNTEAAKSLALLADPGVDDYLIESYLRSDTASELDKVLAIDLLRERGAVFCKSVFYGMLPSSGEQVRSALIRCFREWGELEDLKTILDIMNEYEDIELRAAMSQIFVSVANTRVKNRPRSTAIIKRASRTADASLKPLLGRMEAAIK